MDRAFRLLLGWKASAGGGGQRQPRGSREQLQVESSQAGHEDHELNACLGSRARFLQKKNKDQEGRGDIFL